MMSSTHSSRPFRRDSKLVIDVNEVYKEAKNDEINYYLPCYVRFLVKQIQKISAKDMQAEVLGTLIFTYYYGNLDPKIVKILQNGNKKCTGGGQTSINEEQQNKTILLEFNKQKSLQLQQGCGIKVKQKKDKKMVQYVIRQGFKTSIKGHVFLTPFETLDLYLSVTVQTVSMVVDNRKVSIRFNCMDNPNMNIIRHGKEVSFANYRMISQFTEARFTTKRYYPFQPNQYCCSCNCLQAFLDDNINDEQYQQQIGKNIQYAHFKIPVYKYPVVSILTILTPIQILGAVGLLTFFQSPDLGARLATIAVLILAFVAFMPTINESIPQTPQIKMIDIVIILHLIALVFLGAESYRVKDYIEKDPTKKLSDYPQKTKIHSFQWQTNVFFLLAASLNILCMLIFFTIFTIHKCFWERKFRKIKKDILIKPKELDKSEWIPMDYNQQFVPLNDKNQLQNI